MKLSIKKIENNIPGIKSIFMKDIETWGKGNFANNGKYIYYVIYEYFWKTEKIRILNLKNQNIIDIEYNIDITNKMPTAKHFMINLDFIDNNNYLVESVFFQLKNNLFKIEYNKIRAEDMKKTQVSKKYLLNFKIRNLYQSNFDKHNFIATSIDNYNTIALIHIDETGVTTENYNLSEYNKKGYSEQKFINFGTDNTNLLIRVFDVENRTILTFYDLKKKKIKREIVFDLKKLAGGLGIDYLECSPNSKYVFIVFLKYFSFLLDLETFKLIELPYNNIGGLKNIFLCDWSPDSKRLLLDINNNLFILDIDSYLKSNPTTYKLNSEYFWELDYEKSDKGIIED
jgi:WD40 repeat protein